MGAASTVRRQCVLFALAFVLIASAGGPSLVVSPARGDEYDLVTVRRRIFRNREGQARAAGRRLAALRDQIGLNDFFRRRAATNNVYIYGYDPYMAGGYDAGYGAEVWGGAPLPPPILQPELSVRQPIGRREVQTGPRRWESFPIYEEDLWLESPQAVPPEMEVSPEVEVSPGIEISPRLEAPPLIEETPAEGFEVPAPDPATIAPPDATDLDLPPPAPVPAAPSPGAPLPTRRSGPRAF